MKATFTDDSATIGSTEYSLPNDSTTLTAQTDDCRLQVLIDLSNLAAGDQFQIQIKEKVNGGTQRTILESWPTGAQSSLFVSPILMLGDGWDVTIKKIAGTDRSIAWSLRKLVEGETIVIPAGGITAAKFAADAIDSTVLANNAITANKIAAAAITATQIAADAITANKIATGAITAAKFAAGAIDAAAIATDAIDADALKADAVTEIQSGLATSAALASVATAVDDLPTNAELATALDPLATAAEVTSAVAPLALSTQVDALEAAALAIEADTQDIQARLPAALVSGKMSSHVESIATDAVDAAALKADAVTKVQSGLATAAGVTSAVAPLALEASLTDLATDVADLPTSAELATALSPLATSAGVTTAVAPLATAAGVTAAVAPLALSTQVDALEGAAAAIEADTQDIQGRLPAALVSGRIDASVGAMAANVMTASAAAADLATELQSGLATSAALSSLASTVALSAEVDSLEADVAALVASVGDIQTDATDIKGRLPTALVDGRMDSSVGAMAANVVNAAALAADAGAEIAAAVMAYAHETGLTVLGLFRRLEAYASGKWTGMLGPTATGYRPDGTTKAVEYSQDVDAGTRSTASTRGGD